MFEQIKLHRFLSTKIMTGIIRLSLIGMIVSIFVGVGILWAQSSLVSNGTPSERAKTTGRVSAASSMEDDTFMVHRRAGGPGAESKSPTIFRKAHWREDD
jgi:hypothetical protein